MECKTIKALNLQDFSQYKKDTTLFYIAFYVMAFAKAFGLHSGHKSYLLMFVVSGLLLGIRLLVMEKTWVDYLKVGLLLGPCGLIFLCSRETTLLFTCLFLTASKNVDFETCMKGTCRIYFATVPLRIVLNLLGVVEGGSKPLFAYDSAGKQIITGYISGYGYISPNSLFAVVFIAVLLLFYIRRDKLKIRDMAVGTVFMMAVYAVTRCRTGLIVYFAVLVGLLLYCYLRQKERLLRAYCGLLAVGSLAVGVVFPLIYDRENEIMRFIAFQGFTGRTEWAQNAMMKAGVSLFGAGGIFSDILYVDVLVNSGIVGLAFLLVGMAVLFFAFCKAKNYVGLICVSGMILYACMEQFPLNIAMNPFALYLGTAALFKNKTTT